MDFAITKRPDENFAEPEATPTNLKPILRGIWFDTDTLSSRSGSIPDTSLQNTISSAHDILYFVDKDNPQGPNPRNPENDPQFSYWEYPVSLWKSGLIGASQTSGN
jgi:hypothetical protein